MFSCPASTHLLSLRPAKKERLEETQEDFSEVYSRHSFAVVENPLFADQEDGDDTSYAADGAEGYEYDSGTMEKKEDLVSMCA